MKRFILFILSITLSVAALAQDLYPTQLQEEKTYPVGSFHSLSVSSRFEVTLQEGPCNVKVTADQALLPYFQVYVRGGVLYIEADSKSIPADVKKIYRGKNAPVPVVRAIVTMPAVNSVSLHQNAILSSNGTVFSDSLKLSVEDKAILRNLKFDTPTADIALSKHAVADFALVATNVTLKGEGSSRTTMSFKGAVLKVDLSGSAHCKVIGESETFSFHCERSSELDGLQMKAPRVKADMKGGCEARVLAEELLSVRLTGGSSLYYAGFPTIQVDEILRSTFAPYKEKE
jgi:hypothetical protein